MLNLFLSPFSEKEYQKAFFYFPKDYLESLNKPKESIYARYLISKLVEENSKIKNFLPKIDESWVPIFENNIFWSISHKKDLVFVWISDKRLGIDLEIIKKRNKSLLDNFDDKEYKLLWWKNWENFYILWTGKEAVIKYNLWKLDDMENLKLEKIKKVEKEIWWINFDKKLIISWKVVYNLVDKDKVLSVCL
jgi:phosphopantetheinyl transferase